MKKEEIFDNFVRLFPDYAKYVKKYKKLGSKMIGLETEKGERLSFLYMGKGNWNFGTKPWRKKPIPVKKTSQEKQGV